MEISFFIDIIRLSLDTILSKFKTLTATSFSRWLSVKFPNSIEPPFPEGELPLSLLAFVSRFARYTFPYEP